MTLSQEYRELKKTSTPAVMKCVFGNIAGYKAARLKTSFEEFSEAINNMMKR